MVKSQKMSTQGQTAMTVTITFKSGSDQTPISQIMKLVSGHHHWIKIQSYAYKPDKFLPETNVIGM